ncbi:MAG: hypothetical protein ABW222_07020 [Actinomycetota bacterium]
MLGAMIVSAAIGLVDPGAWHALRLVSRFALGIAAATLLGVVAPWRGWPNVPNRPCDAF